MGSNNIVAGLLVMIMAATSVVMADAWIQESKEINVNGKVMCQDCTKGWNEWVNGTPIKGAIVSVTCMDERRRVIFYGSDATDKAGLFSVLINRYANGKQIKDKLCSVRLVSSPDQTCNVPTDFAGGCKGVKLSRPSSVFKDLIKYTIGPLYYTNPMCEKPDVDEDPEKPY